MAFRGSLTSSLVAALRTNHDERLGIDIDLLEVQAIAHGDPKLVVEALLLLREHGLTADFNSVAAVDLFSDSVVDVALAFVEAQRAHPSLRFADVAARAAKGEDVLAAARSGTLTPLSE